MYARNNNYFYKYHRYCWLKQLTYLFDPDNFQVVDTTKFNRAGERIWCHPEEGFEGSAAAFKCGRPFSLYVALPNNVDRRTGETVKGTERILEILIELGNHKDNLPAGMLIDFSDLTIDIEVMRALALALKSGLLPKDVRFKLSNLNIDDDYLLEFAKVLELENNNSNLTLPEGLELDFSQNPIGLIGFEMIGKLLTSKKCPSYLRLVLGSLQPSLSVECLKELHKALASGNTPEGFYLSLNHYEFHDNEVDNAKIDVLCDILKCGKLPASFTLDLSQCRIDNFNFEKLMTALETGKLPQGFHINLHDMNLNEMQITRLANVLQSGALPDDFRLTLHSNSSLSVCLQEFLTALAHPKCPTNLRLDVSNCDLGEDQQKQLYETICQSDNVRELKVNMHTTNLEAVRWLLIHNTKLQAFDVTISYDHPMNQLISICLKRNQLIAKFPQYEMLIKKICKENGLYEGRLTPPPLEQLSALTSHSILKSGKTLDKKLPLALTEFISEIETLRKLFRYTQPESNEDEKSESATHKSMFN